MPTLIRLHKIQLARPLNQTGECLLLVELILPRNGIARKTSLKDLSLTQGRRSYARQPFYEKALLKEKIDGPCGLKVSLTQPLKHPEFAQFFRRLLATGIESSGDLLASSFLRYHPLQDVLEEAGDTLADRIGEDAPHFLAAGGIDLPDDLSSGKVTIPLKLTQTQRRSDLPPGPKSREKRKSNAKHYRKGAHVGELTLDISV